MDVKDLAGGKLDEIKGEISWEIKLAANKQRDIGFKYQVQHQKNTYVNIE